jgi:hypothetical protein
MLKFALPVVLGLAAIGLAAPTEARVIKRVRTVVTTTTTTSYNAQVIMIRPNVIVRERPVYVPVYRTAVIRERWVARPRYVMHRVNYYPRPVFVSGGHWRHRAY